MSWVLFFDLKTRESQEFFFKSLPFIMRLIVGKKRQEWQREIFLRISTHTHTPPRLLDDGIHIEITESSSRRSRRAPRQKNKRRTRDRRWASSSFLFATGWISRRRRREGRACFGERKRFLSARVELEFQKLFVLQRTEESYEFVAPRKVAETTRRAHASTSKSASRQTTSSIESKRTFERTRRNGSSRLFDAVEACSCISFGG